jgi:hypothetical protein
VEVGNIRKHAKVFTSKVARKGPFKVKRSKKATTFKKKAAKTLTIQANPKVSNKNIENPKETILEE